MKLSLTRHHFACLARLMGALVFAPATLPAWQARRLPLAPIFPVGSADDPLAATFLRAARRGEALAVYYHGGMTPGLLRQFQPLSLYRHRPGGPIYAHGRCLLRDAPRVLRLDRVRLA